MNDVDIVMCLVDIKHVFTSILSFSCFRACNVFSGHSPWKSTQVLCLQCPVGRLAMTSGLSAHGLIQSYQGRPCTKENSVPLVPSFIFMVKPFADVTKLEGGRNEDRNKPVIVQNPSEQGPERGTFTHTPSND